MHVPGFGIKARTDWGKQACSGSVGLTSVTYRAAKVKFGQLQPRLDHLRLAPACTPTALVNFVQTLELRRRYALQAERRCHIVLHRRSVEMNEGPRRMEMSAKFDPTASGKSAQRQQHAGASEPADVAPKGTAGTGEAICPECEGTGKIEGKVCENCGGSGKIIQGVGGA